jgi:hypothetical protein
VVRERLKVYWRDTQPIVQYYGGRPTFRSINGAQTPEQVREALMRAVAEIVAKSGLPPAPKARAARGVQL